MSWHLDREADAYVGHDFPGVCSSDMGTFVVAELELGARVALEIQDVDQTFWVLDALRYQETGIA